ncbi:hypothetical protein QJS04_geneDACA014006 [Acorus gramineus]|uniref:tRNA pseudouridine synthase n=1 Tax=Acorus gramineus TaxID=55184 RepID=A0AAV9AXZ4_ACOGR|nr:hypothetical protein QJS04_geneDACA014006 [Acorus gramineus]
MEDQINNNNNKHVIDNEKEEKLYAHYDHSDPFARSRWTARECYDFMYRRRWDCVSQFYSRVVDGSLSLSCLFSSPGSPDERESRCAGFEDLEAVAEATGKHRQRGGRWARNTFRIGVAYHGGSFDGWQKQPRLNTVQGLIERMLGRFVDERKAQQLKERSLPVEGCTNVAGRTDKGVTALGQVCSFYTWRKDIKCDDIEDTINSAAPGKLRTIFVSEVPRTFHPNFSAKWRHYFYIFPLSGGDKPNSFSVSKVNNLLCQLEGQSLSYRMFARDTKASRSIGPPTECFIFHARAVEARLPCTNKVCGEEHKVMCVELVANRFLRKMVRVLVATSIREAAAGSDCDALLNLMDATCRRATAPPAPPDGLCLADVGYREFRKEDCLIH